MIRTCNTRLLYTRTRSCSNFTTASTSHHDPDLQDTYTVLSAHTDHKDPRHHPDMQHTYTVLSAILLASPHRVHHYHDPDMQHMYYCIVRSSPNLTYAEYTPTMT